VCVCVHAIWCVTCVCVCVYVCVARRRSTRIEYKKIRRRTNLSNNVNSKTNVCVRLCVSVRPPSPPQTHKCFVAASYVEGNRTRKQQDCTQPCMCVHACVRMCMCAFTGVYVCARVWVVSSHTHTCAHARHILSFALTNIHTYALLSLSLSHTHTHIPLYRERERKKARAHAPKKLTNRLIVRVTHTHAHKRGHTHTHTHIERETHTRARAHTHTYTSKILTVVESFGLYGRTWSLMKHPCLSPPEPSTSPSLKTYGQIITRVTQRETKTNSTRIRAIVGVRLCARVQKSEERRNNVWERSEW